MKRPALTTFSAAATGVLLLAGVSHAGASSLASAAKKLSRAAAKAKVSRVAISPFLPLDGSDPAEGRLVSEKLSTRIALRAETQVVERERIDAVLAEHRLARTGLLDPSKLAPLGKLLQAEAMVIGTFVTIGNTLEFNARLVRLDTGVVLAARTARMERSWYPAYGAIPIGSPISPDEAVRDVYEMQTGRAYKSQVSLLARRRTRSPARDPNGWRAEADLRDSVSSGCSGASRRIDSRCWITSGDNPSHADSRIGAAPTTRANAINRAGVLTLMHQSPRPS